MTVPGLPSWALPDRPAAPPPPGGLIDPPLVQRLGDGSLLALPMSSPEYWGPGYNVPGGWDDATQINDAALRAGGGAGGGGLVRLGPWAYTIRSPIVLPQQATLGSGGGGPTCLHGIRGCTVLQPVGAAVTCLSAHRTTMQSQYSSAYPEHVMGSIRDIVIDGSQATGASVGLDAGDGWGLDVDVVIQNFTGAGAIGLWHVNRINGGWSEKHHIRADITNCTQCLVIDTTTAQGTGALRSHEYNVYDLSLFCQSTVSVANAQTGITVAGGAYVSGGKFAVRGNFEDANGGGTPSGCWLIQGNDGAGNWSNVSNCAIDCIVEANNGRAVGAVPIAFGNAANNFGGGGPNHGIINFQFNSWAASNPALGQFAHKGRLGGDPSLWQFGSQPALPASGTPLSNPGNDAMVYISGGTVSSVLVQNTGTGQTSGGFYVPAGKNITVNYSAPPTWNWIFVN